MKYISYILLIIIGLSCYSYSQPDSLYEMATENSDEDACLDELLEYLLTHPIDINRTTRSDLETFTFLNSNQIELILNQRPYEGKRDLRLKIGNDLYKLIRPYCTAKKISKKFKFDLLQRIQFTLQKNLGLQTGKYLGSSYEALTKFRFEYNHTVKAGILFQKDVGECALYDHVSGFIQWQDQEQRLKLIFGNFNIHVGQGLVLSLPYSVHRSFSLQAFLRSRKPNGSFYLSSNENAGFEGAFTGYNIRNVVSLGGFVSQNSKDARIDEDNQQVIDFYYDGYHRTAAELKTKDIVKEKSFGSFLDFSINDKTHFGVSMIRANYEPSIGSSNNLQIDRRNFFKFKGNSIAAYSFFYNVNLPGILISGESATNNLKAISNQHGFIITANNWNTGFKWWRIPVNYQIPSIPALKSLKGEQGIYFALEGHLNDRLNIYLYWYSEKKLWRTYFNPLPTHSWEHYTQIIWTFNYKTQLLCQYYASQIQVYTADITSVIKEFKKRIRIQLEKKVLKNLRLRTRIEQVFVRYSLLFPKSQGINIYQDLFWQFIPDLGLSIRFSCFDTANYDTRIYEYEYDLPGTFSSYPLYGKGIKWYMLCTLKLWGNIQLWIKYRNIHFYGIEVIGSGYSQINGDTKQDIKFQMQIKY